MNPTFSLVFYLIVSILRCGTGFCIGLGCEALLLQCLSTFVDFTLNIVYFIRAGEINQRFLSQNFEDTVIKIESVTVIKI